MEREYIRQLHQSTTDLCETARTAAEAARTFEQYSSDRLANDAEQITAEWVATLTTQLGIPPNRVLPHQELLDDIPVVLRKAAVS